MTETLIFAYGSNLCVQRMRARVASATPVGIGYVPRRRLVFHKRSVDGSGKADAAYSPSSTHRVWGAIYQLRASEKPVLDEHEFLGIGYNEERVEVVQAHGKARAWMYVARREAIDARLKPYSWYRGYVLKGARQHKLPEDYVAQIRALASQRDPNAARHARHTRVLLGSAVSDERHQAT